MAMTNRTKPDFDLEGFLPYLLNQAAEAASTGFQEIYRARYGMSRTQWRVMANLGKFGAMTARDICEISHLEKTKVSRAVAALERDGMLFRKPLQHDRRAEDLALTAKGQAAFVDLGQRAVDYDQALRAGLGDTTAEEMNRVLKAVIATRGAAPRGHDD
jgi:DNA-binding MarR family transcriptional regulator